MSSPFLYESTRQRPRHLPSLWLATPTPPAAPPCIIPSHNKDSTVPMYPPLRSKPSLFTTRGHNEQADTITQLGIGLHVGLNTARGHVCRAVTPKGHHHATLRIFRKIKEGQSILPHRADGGVFRRKKGKNSPFIPFIRFQISVLHFRCLENRKKR